MKQTKTSIRQEKMDRLAKCFGAETGTRTGKACRGKYSGCTDYSVTFNNGERLYICMGTKYFDTELDKQLAIFENFATMKPEILKALHEMERKDNIRAAEMGLHQYRLINVDFVKNDDWNMGKFYFEIEVNGIHIYMVETGLIYAVYNSCRDRKTDYIPYDYNNKFFVAGGIEEEKADFIFNGVGHQSDGDMYRLGGNLFKKMV